MATIPRTPPTLTLLPAEEPFPSRATGKLGSHTVHKIDGDDPSPEALPPARRSVLREWIEKNSPAQKAARKSELLGRAVPLTPTTLSLPTRSGPLPPPSTHISHVRDYTEYPRDTIALSCTQQIVIPLQDLKKGFV
ncbi:MAG: hypothetical protein JSR76_04470 [Verrucomicrobia bacterium]|nr:hypothetical protein [Verrucomicrobiota bacterium]